MNESNWCIFSAKIFKPPGHTPIVFRTKNKMEVLILGEYYPKFTKFGISYFYDNIEKVRYAPEEIHSWEFQNFTDVNNYLESIFWFNIDFIFKWYDFWIGLFWDKKKKWLYIFPLPMCGVIIKFRR